MMTNTYILKVEHRDSQCDFLHRLILWNVFFKMTHVLPLISAQNYDKNALQNRRGRPFLNKFGSLTIVFSVLSFGKNLPMSSIFYAQYLQSYQRYHYEFWQPDRKFPVLLHATILNATYLSRVSHDMSKTITTDQTRIFGLNLTIFVVFFNFALFSSHN